jgi:hypothetical protein
VSFQFKFGNGSHDIDKEAGSFLDAVSDDVCIKGLHAVFKYQDPLLMGLRLCVCHIGWINVND